MKFFSNFYVFIYSIILAIIAFCIYEFKGYQTYSGNGYILYILFGIIIIFIIIMNMIYKIKKDD